MQNGGPHSASFCILYHFILSYIGIYYVTLSYIILYYFVLVILYLLSKRCRFLFIPFGEKDGIVVVAVIE